MFWSSVITLLSVLLGGGLTIFGGVFVQWMSSRNEKRKEIRAMVDKIYRQVQKANQLYAALDDNYAEIGLDPESKFDRGKHIQEGIYNTLQEIELLVDLYLTPLKKDFMAYEKSITENTDIAGQEFVSAVSKFFKEKGYSYF
ncbi:MAG: hypothetical protein ACRDIV_09940 [Ktedonobacteraceae bacterium]